MPESNCQSLLIDLIKLENNTMTKNEITEKWRGVDWGPLRGWAIWNWVNAGLGRVE